MPWMAWLILGKGGEYQPRMDTDEGGRKATRKTHSLALAATGADHSLALAATGADHSLALAATNDRPRVARSFLVSFAATSS